MPHARGEAHPAEFVAAATTVAQAILDASSELLAMQTRELLLGNMLRTELSRTSALVPHSSPNLAPASMTPHERVLVRKGNFRLKKVIFVKIWQNLAKFVELQRLAHYGSLSWPTLSLIFYTKYPITK